MSVEATNKVKVEYEGSLEDGTVFDSSEKQGAPLEFIVGAGMLIEGFDNAVIGMEVGEEKELTIEPENGYGEILEELVRDFPKDSIPNNDKLTPGVTLLIGLPNGMQIAGTVVTVGDEMVKIDMNHPLAGKTLKFKIKVVDIAEGPAPGEECGCGCGHDHGAVCEPETEGSDDPPQEQPPEDKE